LRVVGTVRRLGGARFSGYVDPRPEPAACGCGLTRQGGDLSAGPAGRSPSFLVAALKDPIGANLDRIQIVKGWMNAKGELQEKIYDVSWGGDRKPGKDGKFPPVGSTVDVANATERAFYYVRVIEIPTPRWTAYDAKRFGVQPLPGTSMTLQERAYTSPIWYTPAAR